MASTVMAFSAATVDVRCPDEGCDGTIPILVRVQAPLRFGNRLEVMLGVDHERLAAAVAEHVAEHH